MFTRATIPAEFFDITSDMLLVQPQKQYLHALLIKAALNVELSPDVSLGISADRAIGSSGADYSSAQSDRLMLDDPLLASAVTFVAELGNEKVGHTVRINRPVYLNSLYTQADREIGAGSIISTTPVDVSSEQTSITLKRFGGPHGGSGSVVRPLSVDRFEAGRALHKVAGVFGKQLKDDFDHTLDGFGVALFDASSVKIRPIGMSADNDAAAAGDFKMDYNVISRAEKSLDEASIPYFPNGKRVMVLTPQQCQQLEDDAQFARYAKDHPQVNPLLTQSYYKSVAKFDIFKSNSLTITNNASSVPIHKGQAFGPGMVGAGAGGLPRVAYHTNDNYGEQALVIWLWYAGFQTLDNRFGVGIHTS